MEPGVPAYLSKQPHWDGRPVRRFTSWAVQFELRSARARCSAEGHNHEQWDAEGRTTRCDENPSQLASARRPLAEPFLGAQRTGVHGAWNVHRQFIRRATGRDARGAEAAAARSSGSTAAGPQRNCLLDQSVGRGGWQFHRHERPQRVYQDIPIVNYLARVLIPSAII